MEPIHKVQKIVKILKVLSKLYFISGLVGIIISALCFFKVPLQFIKLSDHELFVLAIESLSLVVMHYFADLYYEHELIAGTPFTKEGVKELKRLGLIYIIVSSLAMALIYIDMASLGESFQLLDISEIWIGLSFIVFSFFAEYGVELEEKCDELEEENIILKKE